MARENSQNSNTQADEECDSQAPEEPMVSLARIEDDGVEKMAVRISNRVSNVVRAPVLLPSDKELHSLEEGIVYATAHLSELLQVEETQHPIEVVVYGPHTAGKSTFIRAFCEKTKDFSRL